MLHGTRLRRPQLPARYDIREDDAGWSVFDLWTGEAVVIGLTPQTGMDIQDADELADLLNLRASRGERAILQ
jgi:hypothetical protein